MAEARWTEKPAMPGEISRKAPHQHRCAICNGRMHLGNHHVEEGPEGPTVSPSVVCPHPGCGGHYFVRNGRVEWC